MIDRAQNIKNLVVALVSINEAKQGMALLDEKIAIQLLLQTEIAEMKKLQTVKAVE